MHVRTYYIVLTLMDGENFRSSHYIEGPPERSDITRYPSRAVAVVYENKTNLMKIQTSTPYHERTTRNDVSSEISAAFQTRISVQPVPRRWSSRPICPTSNIASDSRARFDSSALFRGIRRGRTPEIRTLTYFVSGKIRSTRSVGRRITSTPGIGL